MNMSKKIIALGVSAVSAATFTFSAAGPASAQVVPETSTEQICGALPDVVTGLAGSLVERLADVAAGNADLLLKQVALNGAVTSLVTAAVSWVNTTDAGGNVVAAGHVLDAANEVFADALVNENDAMTTSFEAQRYLYLTTVNQGFVAGIGTSLCPILPI